MAQESKVAQGGKVAQVKHGQLRRPHPVASLLRLVAVVVAVGLVSSACVVAYAAHDVVTTAAPPVHIPHLPGHTAEPLPEAPAGQTVGEVNMLLIGTDTRTGQGQDYSDSANQDASTGAGNNDVNILLHISKDHSSISVVSFPRDLMIPIPSCPTASGGYSYTTSKAMLNTALSRGGDDRHGLACAVLTIEQLTGLDIPYAASVTFAGTSAISTAIGGVTVCLATPIQDDNVDPPLDLKAGEQTVVGDEALSFLRSRHGVGDGSDLGRISNQQVFMSSLARQLTSSSTYANPFKLFAIASAASKNMLLSDTLNVKTLIGIVQAVQTVGLSNMVFVQYPVGEDPDDSNRVVPNAYAAGQLNQALIADRPIVLTGTTGDAAETDPSSTPSAGATSPPSTPASAGSTSPATTPPASTPAKTTAPSASVTLPPSVTGQTAAQKTCSKKGQY
ncbi:LytR family transcriptional attenuator [Frondihabitans sp. PhB188]|uniref:LCP family glycopolymer transferase n=1 Tax=Frondihabitans sp. PhB188 TaxID=2485200 RepID=UPI000F48ED9B|nr:LCP family protein [Frondihabitans sp. PhB188]ROQ39606.1 LytR family transcriptional attenuator [Frondihabitans sp. PhB188]